ncbi:RIIA-like protein [Ruegeria phage vB_RpoP-V21]|uniref:RIIA-like protein n=1 Tax=Ruegeria phage vB_RpoP-V21 TaxID=2218615 RepID=A0A2Z4QG18_9CAUD|nr:RIIA-like protein [Ruegeria phage vB_RpoP-V21]
MQVLNGGDFDQKNVLIGGTGKTESFGVTNDPVLMGMLSTGLYQKPMRTMIQETMFNAWDAHRMGKCQDKAIDIYINDTSGLIIRDYGPGIHKNEIHPIYCIYGNSTKRNNDELTGGFGLGSKSPYAYADSFTVTSHHDGFKGMYIMNRVSEENQGGPGRSIIFEDIPTPESGLVVTIPLKNDNDMTRAYECIKDILYLSGIKARIHFKDEAPEEIFTETVPAGEWIVDEESHKGQLFAVYGGVRYEIINDDAYEAEFRFVRKMANLLGNMYIGFKASTLTPLPSREGLNLNERTVATIKNQLEVMEENFRQMLNPVARVMINESFKSLCESGIEPKFLVEAWVKVGDQKHLSDMVDSSHPIMDAAKEQCPSSMNQSMWNSLCDLSYRRTQDVFKMIGGDKFNTMKYIVWAKRFPQYRHYKDYLLGRISTRKKEYKNTFSYECPLSMADLITAKQICDAASNQVTDIRVAHRDNWEPVENIRRAGKLKDLSYKKLAIANALLKEKKLKLPDTRYPDRLWFRKDGEELNDVYLTKTVILAKTITALKETSFKYQAMFTSKYPEVSNYHNFHRSNFGTGYYYSHNHPVAAIVVHQRNGGYDNALKALSDAGYMVYEADEPEARTRTVKPVAANGVMVAKEVITYPLVNLSNADWADWNNSVENPTCYICVTEHKVRHEYSSDKPSTRLVGWVSENTPRFVILHNKARAGRLEKKDIPSFEVKIHQLVEKILADQDRVNRMVLHSIFKDHSDLPSELRDLPEVQKFFKVPYVRNSQKDAFARDMNVLVEIENMQRYGNDWVHRDTIQLVKDSMNVARNTDSVLLVRKMTKKTKLLNEYELRNHLSGLKPGEVKCFSEKLLRFLRTV